MKNDLLCNYIWLTYMRMIYYHSYLWTFYDFNKLVRSVRKLTVSVS